MSKQTYLVIFAALFIAFPAFAGTNVLVAKIDQNIGEYVSAILSANGSNIYRLVMAIATFLLFMCLVIEVAKFISGDADWVSTATLIIIWFGTMAFIASFFTVTEVIKHIFIDIQEEFQYLTIGSRDKMFLSDFIDRTLLQAIQAPDVGFTDSIWMWFMAIMWGFVSIILQFCFYLSDVYATLGISLAQMVGVLFIPFVIAPWTRKIFDSWFQFFIGWGVCGIILRLTCLLAMLVMKASINAAGSFENPGANFMDENYNVMSPIVITMDNIELLVALVVFGIMSCVLVLSSFAFAKQLASGVGSASGAATNSAKALAVKAIKLVI
ncbi:conjugal transfer protein TrbL [Escherichia coli]|uniref:conjugal transfer protein TrbL n=1 Tax=Escherichia coli TaxID=562 RepID=UPI000BE9A69E|nr:conjugal transfer protein TrbL [Escherichia coli]